MSPSLAQVGIFAPPIFIFLLNQDGLRIGAAEVRGHLASPALCAGGVPALARWAGTWLGLITFQPAAARASGVQSKPGGPFPSLAVPLSSDLYNSTIDCVIYAH